MAVVVEEGKERVDVVESVVVPGGLGVESGEFGEHGWCEERHFVDGVGGSIGNRGLFTLLKAG